MIDVLFITPTEKLSLKHETNGTMLLATQLLRDNFRVEILRFCQISSFHKDYPSFIDDIVSEILHRNPEAVSFYTLWPYYHIMLRIAREIKVHAPGINVILGGPQASSTAEATMNAAGYVDFICSGEGEDTVVPFFRALLRHEGSLADVPGLVFRENGGVTVNPHDIPLCDLNTLPYWDDRLFPEFYDEDEQALTSDTYFMPIDAGRGCPFNCTFCCTSYFWKRTYRLKSPERIVKDIKYWNRKFGIHSFWFSHDAFTSDRRLVAKVCDRILEEGMDIKWRCTARIDSLTEELILKMKQAGMTQIELGIESGSSRMQKLINKKINLNKAKKTIDYLVKQNIQVALFFMYGFPEETEQDLNDTLELQYNLLDLGVNHVSMSFCRFNPMTQITETYADNLTYEPDMDILTRDIFGYDNEHLFIQDNKRIFPYFFHLNTPVRNDYQYVILFSYLYEQYRNPFYYFRRCYNGDNLRFYRDFYEGNRAIFDRGINSAVRCTVDEPMTMIRNMLCRAKLPKTQQLEGLMEYNYDLQRTAKSKEEMTLQKTYNFSIFDLKLKLPIEQYCEGKTEILLQKKDGKFSQKILRVE